MDTQCFAIGVGAGVVAGALIMFGVMYRLCCEYEARRKRAVIEEDAAKAMYEVLRRKYADLHLRYTTAEHALHTLRMNIGQTVHNTVEAAMRQRMFTPSLEPDMVKRLLFLCHPDKHNNSTASKTATEYLMRMRKS